MLLTVFCHFVISVLFWSDAVRVMSHWHLQPTELHQHFSIFHFHSVSRESVPVEDERPPREEVEEDLPAISGESPQPEEGSAGYEGSATEWPFIADRAFGTAESEAGSGESWTKSDMDRYKGNVGFLLPPPSPGLHVFCFPMSDLSLCGCLQVEIRGAWEGCCPSGLGLVEQNQQSRRWETTTFCSCRLDTHPFTGTHINTRIVSISFPSYPFKSQSEYCIATWWWRNSVAQRLI